MQQHSAMTILCIFYVQIEVVQMPSSGMMLSTCASVNDNTPVLARCIEDHLYTPPCNASFCANRVYDRPTCNVCSSMLP